MSDIQHPWLADSIFYQIYPLGLLGAPRDQSGGDAEREQHRLRELHGWIPHLRELGVSALYLGPVFESLTHGYDTTDYFWVDRRLGDNQDLSSVSRALKAAGIRLILDGVFHHVGKEFFAFRDVREKRQESRYVDWFELDFTVANTDEGFGYACWEGHRELVKLNLSNEEVRAHLFHAVRTWIDEFGISGLRLDVAYSLPLDFLMALRAACIESCPEFVLIGEVIHGDYRELLGPGGLDAVTNYECYKGLWSSHVDRNYFEIAHSLNRQFARGGIYEGKTLYSFADNHDVDRVASQLTDRRHLLPLHVLLYTMPGVPSIYAGGEWAILGKREHDSDAALRPRLTAEEAERGSQGHRLFRMLVDLARIRGECAALRKGEFRQLHVASEQFAFERRAGEESVVVALNMAAENSAIELPDAMPGNYEDLLAGGRVSLSSASRTIRVPPGGGCVLRWLSAEN